MVGMSSMITYFNQLTLEKVKEHIFFPDEGTSVSRVVFENYGSGDSFNSTEVQQGLHLSSV